MAGCAGGGLIWICCPRTATAFADAPFEMPGPTAIAGVTVRAVIEMTAAAIIERHDIALKLLSSAERRIPDLVNIREATQQVPMCAQLYASAMSGPKRVEPALLR